ncbi:MAG: tRNA (adenosine(37)-N6)-dimethylallyltransferase MiaA, partial [Rhodospirillaceae bacterium]|nr:tRNA (adenosine(37)-N6)-dimethylallyltransferase MiaA [Rhodospirillaceae bacterium]
YLKALTEGLSPIAEVIPEIRQKARTLWDEVGADEFIKQLADIDPVSAERIAPTDSQRLIRAFEVSLSSGRPFSAWKEEPKEMVVQGISFATVQLLPEREVLYGAINARFDKMMEMGAMIEVKNLLKLGLDNDLPAMKALGVPEIASHIRGEISMPEALEKAKTASRNYAKRQLTWARHQLADGVLSVAQYSESSRAKIFSFIDEFMLTENP